MAKFRIQAGAELDILSKEELKESLAELQSWFTEAQRGVRFRDFSAQATVAAGVWTVPAGLIEPNPGFVWAVTRVAVSGNGFVLGTDTYSIFKGDAAPSKLVDSGRTRAALFDVGVLVVTEADSLVLTGVGTGVGQTDIVVSGAAVEVPIQLGHLLL